MKSCRWDFDKLADAVQEGIGRAQFLDVVGDKYIAIEEKFEKQTKAYNQRIMNYMRVEQRPLTLALICKYAFPKPPQPRHATKPIVDETSEKPSEATQSTKEESGY